MLLVSCLELLEERGIITMYVCFDVLYCVKADDVLDAEYDPEKVRLNAILRLNADVVAR